MCGSEWSLAFLQLGTRGGQRIRHKLLENLLFLGKVWPWLAQEEEGRIFQIKEFCSNINDPDDKAPWLLAEHS